VIKRATSNTDNGQQLEERTDRYRSALSYVQTFGGLVIVLKLFQKD